MESIEEETVHLPCSHSAISGNEYIHWYRQVPLRGPEYVIHGLQQNTSNRMAFLAIPSDRKSSSLILPRVSLSDAAVYHCILREAHCDRQGCTCAIYAWWGRGAAASSKEDSAMEWAEALQGKEKTEEPSRDGKGMLSLGKKS
ncbi:Immunoglobulin V-set, subgroup containing protein [Microtus ochrogaster]|nr:Immunoglobulin V-set, subgroup containing protein [Microtus ochrogaster]